MRRSARRPQACLRDHVEAGAEHARALAVRQHRQVLRLGDVVHREERLEHGARRVVFLPIQGRRDADERGPVADWGFNQI